MPKLNFVKKARKDNPVAKRGESYFWWKFAFGSKQYASTRPPRSRLTQSEYFSTLWELEDGFQAADTAVGLKDQFEDFVADLTELRDSQEEKRENMPESLQESSTGELLQERYEALDDWIDGIECLDTDFDADNYDPGEDSEEQFCTALAEEFTCLFGDAG